VFGSAAWSCGDRDKFIGWGKEQRRHNLSVRGADNHMAIASAIATAKKQDKNIYLMIKDCFNGKPLFDSGA